MNIKSMAYLYGFAIAYTVFSFFITEGGILLITVFGFGLPVILFLLIEWCISPLLAAYFGFQARWSYFRAISGVPLIFLYTIITPFIPGKSTVLPTDVPWLSRFPVHVDKAIPIIQDRLVWWLCVFFISLVFGNISRFVVPQREL